MSKLIGACCYLFFAFCVQAQDTIFIASSQPLLVRVLEISAAEVTYKNFFNPDGVIRTLRHEQIEKIVYENGKTESRYEIKEKTVGAVKPSQLFVVEGKHIAFNNSDITHKEALKIMLQKDPQTNQEELNGALVDAESKRNGQIAFNMLAPVSAVGGIYFARRHRYNDPREKLIARTFIISGLSVCVVSVIAAQIYKSIKNQHIRRAALLYNTELL
jgi:hypothetical protein